MEATANKPYELKALTSKDVFPMFRIISKIGIKEFKDCFSSEEVKTLLGSKEEMPDEKIESIGLQVILNLAMTIIAHVADAENEIYTFLSGVSGMTRADLEALDLVTFTEMIVDVFKKDEFKDFIKVVSKLFK